MSALIRKISVFPLGEHSYFKESSTPDTRRNNQPILFKPIQRLIYSGNDIQRFELFQRKALYKYVLLLLLYMPWKELNQKLKKHDKKGNIIIKELSTLLHATLSTSHIAS